MTRAADADAIERAASAVRAAGALVIAAGAGMGVDSGLPDFRGPQGFWRAYPAYESLGLDFPSLANPRWFRSDPSLAWGFYGHRLELYRRTPPHEGFAILRRLAARAPHGAFVFTSNVDGHFQRAGFDPERVYEVHGAIDFLQCTRADHGIFAAGEPRFTIDPMTFRASGELPSCPSCGALARPNVLMFGDGAWDSARSDAQETRLAAWLTRVGDAPLVVSEMGAGLAVPTVRFFSERLGRARGATLVRINPREPEGPAGTISIAGGALATLRAIEAALA